MRRWHLTIKPVGAGARAVEISADYCEVHPSGALSFRTRPDGLVFAVSAGEWRSVGLLDDNGQPAVAVGVD